jgi:hypothetical protein
MDRRKFLGEPPRRKREVGEEPPRRQPEPENEGARNWCSSNYDSDPEFCQAVGFGKKGMKSGGKVKGYKKGGMCRGGRSAVRGTKFSGVK